MRLRQKWQGRIFWYVQYEYSLTGGMNMDIYLYFAVFVWE